VPGPLTVGVQAEDLVAFLEQVVGGPVRLVGYSLGATVALWTAVLRPDLVERLVVISAAFDPRGTIFRPTADEAPPAPLAAAYAEISPDGPEHFRVVITKLAASANEPGLEPGELRAITCPALVIAADDDLVTLEHTLELYRALLPHGQLAVVPGTSHLLLHEKPDLCVGLVGDFLTATPAPTLMPIARASAPAAPHDDGGTRS
jgi:pimeloyl-ACP methyl ester carboxylesterase